MRTVRLQIAGMTCAGCENKVTQALRALPDVSAVKADFVSGIVSVSADKEAPPVDRMVQVIEGLGYTFVSHVTNQSGGRSLITKQTLLQLVGLATLIVTVLVISPATNLTTGVLSPGSSLGTLFVLGLLTSVHCVGMCGGINMCQCIAYKQATGTHSVTKPSLLYNLGRVVSYTAVGGLAGALGSAFSFSPYFKGMVSLAAGLIMIIMGLNMLGVMKSLRRLIPRLPVIPLPVVSDSTKSRPFFGPFVVGLLNGFMPCGPLQAMHLYALSTGSILQGATAMLAFSLGTFPVMFGFGAFSTLLSKRFTVQLLKLSGVFVILLGVVAMDRGLGLANLSVGRILGFEQSQSQTTYPQGAVVATMKEGYQEVRVVVDPRAYDPVVVQVNVPVKMVFVAEARNLNGCNNAIIIPSLGVEEALRPGETVVEFTPTALGTVKYSCWMNMIRSTITVVEDLSNVTR